MALVGNLRDLKLPNLIQLNCMERNTAKLTVEHAGKYGFLYFQGGQISHAEYDPDIGEKAVYRMLGLNEGKFKVEGGIRPPVVTIKTHWNNLLLEGLHQLDDIQASADGQFKHLLNMLMNVKGVTRCAVISIEGDVISANFEMDNESIVHALTFFQAISLKGLIKSTEPDFISLLVQNRRILLTRHDEHIVFIEMESKHQLESVLPFIRQAIS